MTVMERNSNANLVLETSKFTAAHLNQHHHNQMNQTIQESIQNNINNNNNNNNNNINNNNINVDGTNNFNNNPNQNYYQQNINYQATNKATKDENKYINLQQSSRKNSTTGSIANGMPNSNLSLSSTSSASSSLANSKIEQTAAAAFAKTNSNNSSNINNNNNINRKNSIPNNSNTNYSNTNSSKHNSNSSPQNSRRPSGNSITIRITSENNVNVEDDLLNNEIETIDNENEAERERNRDRDRDEGEDTTSDSTTNEQLKQQPRKKMKDRKKLVRSSAIQQHLLNYQESEDQIDEERNSINQNNNDINNFNNNNNNNNIIDNDDFDNDTIEYPTQTINSAFDELFAAAESGNSAVTAAVEAKMAAVTAAATEAANENIVFDDSELPFSKKNSIGRSRNSSFRSRQSGSSIKRSPRTPPGDLITNNNELNGVSAINNANNNSSNTKKNQVNVLKVEGYLGSPQQLTRSCSCKRPGSFKKMRAKNTGVSPTRSPNRNPSGTNNIEFSKTSPAPIVVTTPANVSGRRGTQCSISVLEDLESGKQGRAGSLPFENLNNLMQPNQLLLNTNDADQEVYRVRQFNITNKGSIINRGDSFKRSFKRSNNSLSSKKDNSPTITHDGNTLNLPDFQDGTPSNNKSINSSNCGLNDINFNVDGVSSSGGSGDNNGNNGFVNANFSESGTENNTTPASVNTNNNNNAINQLQPQESMQTFVVYVIGASSVGKNALIKQFRTSEYRGTYEINGNQSADEDPEDSVVVMLDGIESRLQFVPMDIDMIKPGSTSLFEITKDNDGFIVVYSISDKTSFTIAVDILKSIRISENKSQPVILVGNKSDLVRKRCISREDGRNAALKYSCKFVETSVAINDKVDDLLVGILKQIRLSEGIDKDSPNQDSTTSFIENNTQHSKNFNETTNKTKKQHNRNYSDAHLQDLIKKANNNSNNNNSNNLTMFKSNTLSRRLFRSKNKENNIISTNNNNSDIERCVKSNRTASPGSSSSFFHKLFNTIFKKKSSLSHLQSVENLFTPPVSSLKTKKN